LCAASIAIRSRLSDERVHDIFAQSRLDPLTHLTETNLGKLLERVDRVARRAYEGVGNETVLGDISLAALVTDHSRMAADAAINVSVPTFR
jgi:IclR family transcriptional regulator, pca regulon regulatory protein